MLDERFLAEIDAAFPQFGYSDRSTFIREAVIRYLGELGIKVPISYKAAPPRQGSAKGGRPKKDAATKKPSIVAVPGSGTGKKQSSTPSRKTAS